MLVSHGGFLREAFGEPHLDFCECRALDVNQDGVFARVSGASTPTSDAGPRPVEISGVEVVGGVTYYRVAAFGKCFVLRRFNDFIALRDELVSMGLEAFVALFPSKLNMGDRMTQLHAWLQAVVATHNSTNVAVARFFQPAPESRVAENLP